MNKWEGRRGKEKLERQINFKFKEREREREKETEREKEKGKYRLLFSFYFYEINLGNTSKIVNQTTFNNKFRI